MHTLVFISFILVLTQSERIVDIGFLECADFNDESLAGCEPIKLASEELAQACRSWSYYVNDYYEDYDQEQGQNQLVEDKEEQEMWADEMWGDLRACYQGLIEIQVDISCVKYFIDYVDCGEDTLRAVIFLFLMVFGLLM